MSKKIKQAESREVMRSSIQFADYNPRKLSDEARKKLKANLKRIGLAGGIVWNEATGNLVSGHQRLSLIDEIQHYDAETKDNDYPIRVEVLSLSDKEEKEQNIFFNSTSAQGEWDNDMLAQLIPQVDVELAGLDRSDIDILMAESPVFSFDDYNQAANSDFQQVKVLTDEEREARKEHVKAVRQEVRDGMESEYYEGEAYVTLSFQNYENKVYFMEQLSVLMGEHLNGDDRYIKGEKVHEAIMRQTDSNE